MGSNCSVSLESDPTVIAWERKDPLSNAEYAESCDAISEYWRAWDNAKGRSLVHRIKCRLGFRSAKLMQSNLDYSTQHIRKIAGRDSEHHRMLLWIAGGRYEANERNTKGYVYLERSITAFEIQEKGR